jgi:hypothetical protein
MCMVMSMGTRNLTWRREAVELAALFITAGAADLFASTLGHDRPGPAILLSLGFAVIVITGCHQWWAHRSRSRERAGLPEPAPVTPAPDGSGLWRVRTEVQEAPGRLAALTAVVAAIGGNIVSLNSQTDLDGTIDEFFIRLPGHVSGGTLIEGLNSAGGRATSVCPANVHELVDPVTRALHLAGQIREDPAHLAAAVAELLDAVPIAAAGAAGEDDPAVLVLHRHTEQPIRLHRPGLPFTATEIARATAVLRLADPVATDRPAAGGHPTGCRSGG